MVMDFQKSPQILLYQVNFKILLKWIYIYKLLQSTIYMYTLSGYSLYYTLINLWYLLITSKNINFYFFISFSHFSHDPRRFMSYNLAHSIHNQILHQNQLSEDIPRALPNSYNTILSIFSDFKQFLLTNFTYIFIKYS